jgi:hypothetical protein
LEQERIIDQNSQYSSEHTYRTNIDSDTCR